MMISQIIPCCKRLCFHSSNAFSSFTGYSLISNKRATVGNIILVIFYIQWL
jgi:hypothetical protein